MMHPISALLSAGGHEATPVIDWDWTILIQAGIFLALFVIMRKLVFLPYLEARQEREDNIDGVKERAEQSSSSIEKSLATYEQTLASARKEAAKTRSKLRSEGEEEAQNELGEAQKSAERSLETARERIQKSVPAAELALRTRADDLARVIATKVLGRPV
ncbi:MAG: ATP synthase F0 subunit B [Deltaproteobacteria bacterium]|nr:ATP synthase F0 subunit B [Deltaproteobacteria bacterium]